MKEYEKPTIIVFLVSQDLVASSKELESYDDTGSWNNEWSNTIEG